MAKVTWTFQALEDVDAIGEYQAQYSEKYASLLIEAFLESTRQLESFPFSGRIVPELNLPSVRELIIRKYRIVYSIPNSDEVYILTVRPSSIPFQDIPFRKED